MVQGISKKYWQSNPPRQQILVNLDYGVIFRKKTNLTDLLKYFGQLGDHYKLFSKISISRVATNSTGSCQMKSRQWKFFLWREWWSMWVYHVWNDNGNNDENENPHPRMKTWQCHSKWEKWWKRLWKAILEVFPVKRMMINVSTSFLITEARIQK